MLIINGLHEIEYSGETFVAIGKFDGIHAGHRKLIKNLAESAKAAGLKSVVFTFAFKDENAGESHIYSEEIRKEIFKALGVDYLVIFDLNEDTMKMEPEEFARTILKKRLHAKTVVCGPDLSFGYKGRGGVELLKSMEPELNIGVKVIKKVKYHGEDISSTRIRKAIADGNFKDAGNMLGGA